MMTAAPSPVETEKPQIGASTEQPEVLTPARGKGQTAGWLPRGVEVAGMPKPAPEARRPQRDWLYGSMLEFSSTRPRRATLDFLTSIGVHSLVIAALVLAPIMFTEAIDLTQFTQMRLVAPPPPPAAPPPPAQMMARTRRVPNRMILAGGKLLSPSLIPEKILMLHEKPLPPEIDGVDQGVVGGVPGGIPGGQTGGVLGSILSGVQKAPPAPPAVGHKAPIRVGGRVKPPRRIFSPSPEYPPLARQARVEGVVVIDAVIDVSGNVVEAKIVSGPPLLLVAALEAVQRWKFEPTYLDEEPVAVKLLVTVEFHLSAM